MINLTYLIGLIADFVKGYYKKDVDYSIKKYMDVNKYIFSREYNVGKCKFDFSAYTLYILAFYIIATLIALDKLILPNIKENQYFTILIYLVFIIFILGMLFIDKKLFRFFLGDIGDLKNSEINHGQRRKQYKDMIFILALYVISYVSLLLFLITSNKWFVAFSILMILIIIPVNLILEKKLEKIGNSKKKYYKDTIKLKAKDGIREYKPSNTVIQILSNCDLIIIEDKLKFAYLIKSDEIEYINIENDLYYIEDGKYLLKENFFKNKSKLKKAANKNICLRKRYKRGSHF